MDSTAAQWTQEFGVGKSMGGRGTGGAGRGATKVVRGERAVINCPRCQSRNTKFCYYNNYSLTQPRYLCKTCRRYWTEGGTLRNVPVGGGSRKNKRYAGKPADHDPRMHAPSSSSSALHFNSFIPPQTSNAIFPGCFPFQEYCKPSLDDVTPHHQNMSLMFALGATKPNTTTTTHDQQNHNSNGSFWFNGMLGGGGSAW